MHLTVLAELVCRLVDFTKSTETTPKDHAFRCAYFQFIPILNEDKLNDHARQNHNSNALRV